MVSQRLPLPSTQSLSRVLIALAIFTLVAACGTSPTEEPSAAPSTSLAPSSAPPSVAALPSIAPFDHGEIPAEVVGRYVFQPFDREMAIDLEADGTYVLMSGPLAFGVGTVEVRGAYGVFGDEMRFGNEVAVSGTACPPGDGVYTWSLDGKELTLTVVDDPCGEPINRIAEWEAGWTRAD